MAANDKVSDKIRGQWQIAASGLTTLLAKMNGIPKAYAAQFQTNSAAPQNNAPDDWVTWIKLEYGQSSSLGLIFPKEVYEAILNKFEGYAYGNTRIIAGKEAPANVTVVASKISCDLPPTGVIRLYHWDYVDFTESAITGAVNGNRLEFANVPVGIYILADDSFEKFPSTFITVV